MSGGAPGPSRPDRPGLDLPGLGQVLAGPFARCPPGVFGLCLDDESPARERADRLLPVPDFGLPPDPAALDAALREVMAALRDGRGAFVGCRAGLGRTGLALACLARMAGVEGDPVAFVRAGYDPRAVETAAQEAFARAFRPRHPFPGLSSSST